MQCEHVRPDGTRCKVTFGVDKAERRCWHHAAKWRVKRERATALGGRTTAAQKRVRPKTIAEGEAMEPPRTAEEAKNWSAWLVRAVVIGAVDKGVAQQASTALRTFLTALEKSDYEKALAEVQAEVRAMKAANNTRKGKKP